MSFKYIEEKWQKNWEEAKIFEADPDTSKEKVFVTFPYPYLNGPLHLGHAYTCTKVDIYARFKRMQGYNVLFPQGWHATGEPIQGVAERIKEGDEDQIRILVESGIPREEVLKFSDPKKIVEYYRKLGKEDMKRMGFSIDWRREFITTTITPTYSRFIEWQCNTLRKKGYIIKGTHPVIWCPHCKSPTGDHDRLVGEGVSPALFTLLKFKYKDSYIVVATLRPETIFGVTNIWINPEADYVEALVDEEKWIISKRTALKLEDQLRSVKVLREFKGKELVGKECTNLVRKDKIYILPANFVDPYTGTGIVMSVPSHAPYDYLALIDLKKRPENLEKYGIDLKVVKEIKPISIIKVKGYGEYPAIDLVKRIGVKDQLDPKAKEATREIYRKEFNHGIMKENCGKYKGMLVKNARDLIAKELREKSLADSLWDPEDVVICRCGTRTHVKILQNQWFLRYGDPEWKRKIRGHLKRMRIYPEEARQAFEYTIDWLKDKPCARRAGLGTPVPWDPDWIVETLTDSVIYMAYYTIAKHINKYKIPAEKLTDDVFDYIFLGRGNLLEVSRKSGLSPDLVDDMRKEFEYWYPVDLRVSAKELIYNHLTFYIYNHVAIFRPEHWPRAIGVNGMIMVEGRKMSKRFGNFITIREALSKFSADVVRFSLAYFGEGLEDPNWKEEEVQSFQRRLHSFYNLVLSLNKTKIDRKAKQIDRWLYSRVQRHIIAVTNYLEELRTRSALQEAFFEMINDIKWYVNRRGSYGPAYEYAILILVKLMAPFIPHLSDEMWERLGFKGFASISKWPKANKELINEYIEEVEEYIMNLYNDITEIMKVLKKNPKKIEIFVAERWKYEILKEAQINKNNLIKRTMKRPEFRKIAKEAVKYINNLLKGNIPLISIDQNSEMSILKSEIEFFKRKFGVNFEVKPAELSSNRKARIAEPLKPGILLLFD